MTTVTKKLTLVAFAAAAIAATPAMANSYRHSSGQAGPMASEGYVVGNAGYDSYAQGSYGNRSGTYGDAGYDAYAAVPGGNMVGAPGVISYDRYAGWDPDPAIRLMLKRDATGGDSQ